MDSFVRRLRIRGIFTDTAKDFWQRIVLPNARQRNWLTGVTGVILVLIGLADFLIGFEASLLGFYFIPIVLAVIARGWKFGVVIGLASVVIWIEGDLVAGAHFASPIIPIWNASIALLTYLVLIGLFSGLIDLQRDLEERVIQRTLALTAQIAERERLEKAVLEIGERERRRIGHDLHDGLGQHLAGTAFTGQLLVEKLRERGAEEAADVARLVSLVRGAVEQTREMAKGLLLAEIDSESLPDALREFCGNAATQFSVDCIFSCEGSVSLAESGVATHLYRVAQEAVRNAIRHGNARHIEVDLLVVDRRLVLTIRDDGIGLPPPEQRGHGLGLRIMAHRARMIGAAFAMETPPEGGTIIGCNLQLYPT